MIFNKEKLEKLSLPELESLYDLIDRGAYDNCSTEYLKETLASRLKAAYSGSSILHYKSMLEKRVDTLSEISSFIKQKITNLLNEEEE